MLRQSLRVVAASSRSRLVSARGGVRLMSSSSLLLAPSLARGAPVSGLASSLGSPAAAAAAGWCLGQLRGFAGKGPLPDFENLGMPSLSPTMEKGTIAQWIKKEGEFVQPGEIYCTVETDKAVVDFEAQEEGYLAKILLPEGTADIPVGQAIAILTETAEDAAKFKDVSFDAIPSSSPPSSTDTSSSSSSTSTSSPSSSSSTSAPSSSSSEESASRAAPSSPSSSSQASQSGASSSNADRVFASPLARSVARAKGVSLEQIGTGTGPSGRIIKADVDEFQPKKSTASDAETAATPSGAQQAASAHTPQGAYTDIPHSNVRKVIASRLLQSKQTIPHYYLTIECEMDSLLAVRSQLNQHSQSKISVNDFIIKASALALCAVPQVNSSWMDNAIREYHYVDISVAVSTDNGLITPIVKDADKRGLQTISSDIKSLASKARENKLQPHEYQGGTFTVSNLGMFGVKQFAAIINPPQACILAVGSAEKRLLPSAEVPEAAPGDDSSSPVAYREATVMTVTLSCDHRVVDGAVGAQWLSKFQSYIQNPMTMLL